MEIIVGKTAGFCFGVKNAVTRAKEELEKTKPTYCIGQLVHNNQVISQLEKNGMIFINSIDNAQGKTIIRAHGIPKTEYKKAKERQIELLDLTCPKVIHIHNIAEEYSKKGYYIFLIGQKTHPEIIGTISFCGKNSYIIEKEEEINSALEKFDKSGTKKALIIAQTTYSIEKFNKIAQMIKQRIKNENIEIKNTICNATKQRQEETKKISSRVKVMVIIGSKTSSNSNKLYEISKKYCQETMFIETENELEVEKIKGKESIGIMAGASTPQKSIEKVIEKIKKIC